MILVSTCRFLGVKEFNKHVKIDLQVHRLHKMADKMADEELAPALNVRETHLLVAAFKIHR